MSLKLWVLHSKIVFQVSKQLLKIKRDYQNAYNNPHVTEVDLKSLTFIYGCGSSLLFLSYPKCPRFKPSFPSCQVYIFHANFKSLSIRPSKIAFSTDRYWVPHLGYASPIAVTIGLWVWYKNFAESSSKWSWEMSGLLELPKSSTVWGMTLLTRFLTIQGRGYIVKNLRGQKSSLEDKTTSGCVRSSFGFIWVGNVYSCPVLDT